MQDQQHEWIAMIAYRLTEDDARKLMEGPAAPPVPVLMGNAAPDDERAFLKMEQIDQDISALGCWKCEQIYSAETAKEPCPGNPTGYKQDGEPIYA